VLLGDPPRPASPSAFNGRWSATNPSERLLLAVVFEGQGELFDQPDLPRLAFARASAEAVNGDLVEQPPEAYSRWGAGADGPVAPAPAGRARGHGPPAYAPDLRRPQRAAATDWTRPPQPAARSRPPRPPCSDAAHWPRDGGRLGV